MNTETCELAQGGETPGSRLQPGERYSRIVNRLAVYISLLVFFGVLTELLSLAALSLFFSHQNQAEDIYLSHSYYQDKPWAFEYWKEFLSAWQTQYKPYVVWRRAPFAGKYVNVDKNGIRRTINPSCTAGAPRIWMFGASVLWGTGARDEDTIPSMLAQEYTSALGPVCVTNFGETGWVNTQEVIQLELALKRTSELPDLVIFYDGFGDAFMQYQSDQVDSHQNLERMRSLVENNRRKRNSFLYFTETNTYRLIDAINDKITQSRPGKTAAVRPRDLDRRADMASENYLQNMKLVDALSKSYGFQYESFWAPHIALGHKPLTPPEREIRKTMENKLPGIVEMCQRTSQLICSTGNPHCVNLNDVFDQTPGDLYLDMAHTSPVGNRLVAQRMLEELRKSGIVPVPEHGRRR